MSRKLENYKNKKQKFIIILIYNIYAIDILLYSLFFFLCIYFSSYNIEKYYKTCYVAYILLNNVL